MRRERIALADDVAPRPHTRRHVGRAIVAEQQPDAVAKPVAPRIDAKDPRYLALRNFAISMSVFNVLGYAVLGFEQPAQTTAALCGLIAVLRLEGGLYVNLPAGEVLGRLDMIGRATPPEVREMLAAVDAASASATVSMYR